MCAKPTTVYRSAGAFWVTVTVVDANGLSDSAGMQTAVSANMLGTEWILANTLPGTSITLQFSNDNLGGFGAPPDPRAAPPQWSR